MLEAVTSALTTVIGWVGSVVTALTTTDGQLSALLPLLIAGKRVKPVDLGTRMSFADIAATVTELLGVEYETPGKSFAKEIL